MCVCVYMCVYVHVCMCIDNAGMSRRSTLAYRPLHTTTLSDLVTSYRNAYEEVGHSVKKITVGLPFDTYERSGMKGVYVCMCICVCVYVCVYMCMCVCMCVCVCM
jgi:hypothetical protein